MTTMIPTRINDRWTLNLPEHRAARPQWGTWTDGAGLPRFGWEVERLDSMYRNILPGDVVYDIGTEEGDLSALLHSWASALPEFDPTLARQTGGVCLFEPSERVWPNVRAIWEANDLTLPLAVFAGFAADDTDLSARPDAGPPVWPQAAYGPLIEDHGFANLAERPDIARITLDDFSAVHRLAPNVITMDVEGSELRVLRGAQNLLAKHKPLVYVSVHPDFMMAMYRDTEADLHAFMGEAGYDGLHLGTDHEQHWAFWHPQGRVLA